MPNHVTNRVIVSGPIEDVAAFKKLMVVEDKQSVVSSLVTSGIDIGMFDTFDFNQVIPMPPILLRVRPQELGPNGRVMLDVAGSSPWSNERVEATVEEQAEIEKVGPLSRDRTKLGSLLTSALGTSNFHDWYSWSLDNWGTKWNAYDYRPVEDHARFEFKIDTAWSAPTPVYDKLAEKFPSLTIDLAWYDEGGCHAGIGTIGALGEGRSAEDMYTEARPDLYKRVYGEWPTTEAEEEREWLTGIATPNNLRWADNHTCYDVGEAMSADGSFPLTTVTYGDDFREGYEQHVAIDMVRESRDQIKRTLGI